MRKTLLAVEFFLLYAGVPLCVTFLLPARMVLPVLWTAAFGCWLALRLDPGFDRSCFWKLDGWAHVWKPMLLRFTVSAALLAGLLLWRMPSYFLRLPLDFPWLWALILVLYPVLSVMPQGIVFRVFLFHRYRGLMPEKMLFALAALAFSIAHLPFRNVWAILFTLAGGVFFAHTYRRTGSALVSWAEHALYGCLIFTLGYGPFFYHGTQGAALALRGFWRH